MDTNAKECISYKDFESKLNTYEKVLRKVGGAVHTMSPCHPIKKYLHQLIEDIRGVPQPILSEYFDLREKSKRGCSLSDFS